MDSAPDTASQWLHREVPVTPPTRLHRLRTASLGARLLYGALLLTVLAVLYALVSFVVTVEARSAHRKALEQAAVDALPPGSTVQERGVFAAGDATGYAGAVNPVAPHLLVETLQPRGGSRWLPIEGTATETSRAWGSASGKYILTIDVTPCSSDHAPVGCPAGGSALRVQVAPGGPNS